MTKPTVQIKVLRTGWDPLEHPRDRRGRFIEIGALVRIWGGVMGTVERNVGHGRLEVRREHDGQLVAVHRNYLTVVARPDGGEPSDDADSEAAPVEAPSVDTPDVTPGLAATADEGDAGDAGDESAPTRGARVGEPFRLPQPGGGHWLMERLATGRDDQTLDRTIARVERRDGVWGVYPPQEQAPAMFQTGQKREAVWWADDYADDPSIARRAPRARR